MSQQVKAILLDIEGTVSSISFVRDVLFPYTLSALPQVLQEQWTSDEFAPYRNEFPPEYREDPKAFLAHVEHLTKNDVKIAYLKNLQGYLWLTAYRSGEVKAPIYPDVISALKIWTSEGFKVYIYSSGSVMAQKLFFEYTDNEEQPDLRPFLSGHFDTVNAGLKTIKESYEVIMRETGYSGEEWVFLTDNVNEVKAATAAGMYARIVVREGNVPVSDEDARTYGGVVTDFVEDEGLNVRLRL
ncbi:enolase-phosphatase E1 [Orbilia ellipsospora]|uniref:Enolase-phosphatase E1 n=1 Tax=Orbilia ellipsospora TaxID=2528407 RepID=A0AAV9XL28_9PEZI